MAEEIVFKTPLANLYERLKNLYPVVINAKWYSGNTHYDTLEGNMSKQKKGGDMNGRRN